MMNIVTEVVSFETQEGIGYNDFVKIVDMLECEFHSKQPGFVDTELLHDSKNGIWIMIQHWESMDDLKNASKKMFEESKTKPFCGALNTNTIKISTYPQIQVWK